MSSDNARFLVSRKLIMGQHRRCSSSDLDDWIEDLRYSLGDTGRFTRVRVWKTGESDRMVETTCVGRGSEAEVIAALESAWERDIRYNHAAAHATTSDEHSVSLEFVTASEPDGVYITGRVVARRDTDPGPGCTSGGEPETSI